MILTNKCANDFYKSHSFITNILFLALPEAILNIVIHRWFNSKTKVGVDVQNWWKDGFDWAVMHPYLDEVYVSHYKAGHRPRNFDRVLNEALIKANEIYNRTM